MYRGTRLVAAAPLYLRTDSIGEFVFDWSWAEAFQRAGGRYYPKLVSAIPFTPVCGERLLVDPQLPGANAIRADLARQLVDFGDANRLSSLHVLFAGPESERALLGNGLVARKTVQFRWQNRGHRDFQDFLDALTAKRRKEVRRERNAVAAAGIEIEVLRGSSIGEEQWRFFHECYCSTFEKRWGSPRFTLDFFQSLGRRLPESTLLLLARRGPKLIAGAFAMQGGNALYGRHWGCLEEVPFLHFELCYYRTIEHAIESGLQIVDAGVQGEHKLARGFEPVAATSCHWIRHEGFRNAVAEFVARESQLVETHVESLLEHSPYKCKLTS
jgi:hypothetical protein